MRDLGEAALTAIEAGTATSVGAVSIFCAPNPVHIWGGYGELTIGENVHVGVGDRGLVSVVAAAVGGSAQNITLELSGVDPTTLSMFDMSALRQAPVICYRLVFGPLDEPPLATPVFARGRLDQAPKEETPGGTATIRALVETAARGLRRGGGRTRSDADQRCIDPLDDGLRGVSFAGQTTLYWGGKIPQPAAQAFGGYGGGGVGTGGLGSFDNLNLQP